jgi:hypothetical protein
MAKKQNTNEKIQDFLDKAKKQLKMCIDADEHNRKEAVDCLKMLNGDNHWDDEEIKRRKLEGRPCLKVPLFPVFVNQVVGDMLHNRARAKVKPGDHKSSLNIAKIRSGILADIEYQSNGEDIYMTAGKTQVACGYGAWRINTRYTEENPFVQEMYMEAIPNPFNVYLDPKRKDEAGADAKFGFVLSKFNKDDFESEWPDAEFPADVIKTGAGVKDELYFDKDCVTVAEYFVIKQKKIAMCQMEDGTVITKEEAQKLQEQAKSSTGEVAPSQPQPVAPLPATPPMAPGAPPKPALLIIKERDTYVREVKHYTITATQILGPRKSDNVTEEDHDRKLLDGMIVPGEYVPIIMVLGITSNIEGKTHNKGIIRDGKDAQKLINYWETSLAEAIALAPKAPWMLTPKQVEGFEEDYKNANVKNNPFLLYNMDVDSGVPAPPPMRQRPADPPVALFSQAGRSVDNLKLIVGMSGADIGQGGGPERTGAAVYAKQKPSDVGLYTYSYKLNRAIAHSAKIMNSMIPTLYDTERDVRIRNIDDSESVVPVNTTVRSAIDKMRRSPQMYTGMNTTKLVELYQREGDATKLNDISVGKYEVVVTVGPSYTTARQEASQQMLSLINSVPQIGKIGGDLLVEGIMDNAQGEKLAARLRKTLPPGLVLPREGETPFNPPPPPQAVLAIQKQKTEQIKQQKAMIEQKVAMIKLYKETQETDKEIRKHILTVLAELHAPDPVQPMEA